MGKKFKLRNLLVFGISGLIILLLMVQGAVLSYALSDLITSEVYNTSQELLEQKSIRLNEKISEIRKISLTVALNDSIIEGLSGADEMSSYEQVHFIGQTIDQLSSIVNARDEISQIVIINDSMDVYNYGRINTVIESAYIKDEEVIEALEAQDEGIIAAKSNYLDRFSSIKSVITYHRRLYDNSKYIGTLCIVIDESELSSIIQEHPNSQSSDHITFVLNEEQQVVMPHLTGESNELNQILPIIESLSKGSIKGQKIKVDGNEYYLTATDFNDYGLRIVQLKPYDVINQRLGSLFRTNIMIGIICVVFAVAVERRFTKSIARPVRHLLEQMENVGKGNFDISIKETYVYEVNELSHGFEAMTYRIASLIEEVHNKHKKMRLAEFSALQSQINPHFLYNTLDAINWMAIKVNAHDISNMVSSLGKLFRIGLNNGRDFIAIEKEIEHLRMYMKIEAFRYNNRFQFIEEYEEGVMKYQTIKLILQPIVENSLIHGLGHVKGEGTIRVKAKTTEQEVVLTVTDDGIGVLVADMNALLAKSDSIAEGGYGIRNINERIKIHYGDEFGIRYCDVEQGTKVEVRIPKIDVMP